MSENNNNNLLAYQNKVLPEDQQNLAIALKDPKFYLENFTQIKNKQGKLVPFILNEAQKDIFNTMNAETRISICKARQIGFCLHPDTLILTSDLRWIKLNDIQVGQEIIGVDEFSETKHSGRKFKSAVIENKWDVFEDSFLIKCDNGEEIIATGQHKFLYNTSHNTVLRWVKVEDMKVGQKIRYTSRPTLWDNKPDFEDGWIAGMYDGEGSIYYGRTGASLAMSQRIDGPVWQRMLNYFNRKDYKYRIEYDRRLPSVDGKGKLGTAVVGKIVISSMSELMKLLGTLRPTRIINRRFWEGKRLPDASSQSGLAKIISITSLGKQRMIDLQTSTKTFIANGFVSHNSTAITGYAYHHAIMNEGATVALIGYNTDLTQELLAKVKMFYETTPPQLKPKIAYNTKYEISFPVTHSKIMVLPSTGNVGRGYTINFCLGTEYSFWENAEIKMTALQSAVPASGKIVLETTPSGTSSHFFQIHTGENNWIKKNYGWWWLYSKDEIEEIRRSMDARSFAQEYGLEFLSSGRSVFDPEIIKQHRKNILLVGQFRDDKVVSDFTLNEKKYLVKEVEGVTYYSDPEPEGVYCIGADTSAGVTGGDYSVAIVFNRKTGEEVAQYRGLIAPDRFATLLDKLGRKYNNALLAVEDNNHGLTTLTMLKNMIYPSLYFRPQKFNTLSSTAGSNLGWRTNTVTKPLMIDDLNTALREHSITIHSKNTLDEMMTFVYDDNGNMKTASNFHDDGIMATAIALQAFKLLHDKPVTQIDYSLYLPMRGY